MDNSLVIQVGSILATLAVTLIGIFRGLVPKLLESYESRLADKDRAIAEQTGAVEAVCLERREITTQFLESLETVVAKNSESMNALTHRIESFQDKMADDHRTQHENHRDLLDILRSRPKEVN